MASPCRICHPEKFTTKDPDPRQIEVDDTEYTLETIDSDDEVTENSSTSESDDDHGKDNPGNADRLDDHEAKEGTRHVKVNSGRHNNDAINSGNHSNTSDQTSAHTKNKRDAQYKNDEKQKCGTGRRGKRNRRRSKENEGKRLMSRVLMPDQEYYSIEVIVRPHWKCGSKTKLVNLGPDVKRRNREFDIVETAMQKTIADHDNCGSGGGCFDQYNIIKIQKIIQGCAWRRYQTRKTDVMLEADSANEKMLFHGTDAVWNIVSGGFDERFSSSNGQFGPGLYFAQHSSLANQFVFGYFGGNGCKNHQDKNCYICERLLLLCRVTLGKAYQLKSIENMAHPPPGYHSVEAVVGKAAFNHPEYVIYRGEQAYPEYLITYKIVKPKEVDNNNGEDDSVIDPSRLDGRPRNLGVGYQILDGRHKNLDGRHSNLDERHPNVDGRHQNPDGRHQNPDGRYQNPDGRYQNPDGRYQNLDGRHPKLEGRGGDGRGNNTRGDRTGDRGGGYNRYYNRN